MKSMSFNAKVDDNGKAHVYHRGQMEAFIASMAGKEIVIKVEKMVVKRTPAQNRGLHLLLTYFTNELNNLTGNDLSMLEIKDMIKLKRNMLVDVVDRNSGEVIGQKLGSVNDLDLTETSDLIEWIYSYAFNEWNIKLPPLEQFEK